MIPTLAADAALTDCLLSLEAQTLGDFEVIVVDNSGFGRGRQLLPPGSEARLIQNASNAGFGAAVNQGIAASQSPFVATLNDDTVAHPGWIAAMLHAISKQPKVGLCASQVRLQQSGRLDSAGMLIAGDASSKQRGHGEPSRAYGQSGETLLPSGSAALYRRAMLEEIGGFDGDFFLYCEDTDLGLRAQWAGWRCLYVADAIVEHRYSHSAGRASALKAYYVERNRLYVAVKNFPARMLLAAPFVAMARYSWHLFYLAQGQGKASEFVQGGGAWELAWFVIRAHFAALAALPGLLAKRRQIGSTAKISAAEFSSLLRKHWLTPREVAAH